MSELIPLTRTPIFSALVSDYRWSGDLLTAIASARALGVPRFEIDVSDTSQTVPVTESRGKDAFGMQAYETVGHKEQPTMRVSVYAIRVEGAT